MNDKKDKFNYTTRHAIGKEFVNGYEVFLKKHICKICHVGIMKPHDNYRDTIKCGICGYAEIIDGTKDKSFTS